MTSPYLLGDLRRDEGLRLVAYPDPLTHAAPWTIGYGHTGPDVYAGLEWSTAQADDALAADVAAAVKGLDATLPWWRSLDDLRQDCLANMAFNIGVAGLAGFDTFLGYMRQGAWPRAALDLAGTEWARQVGARAQRVIAQIRTGQHQA